MNQPEGLQTELLKLSRPVRNWVLELAAMSVQEEPTCHDPTADSPDTVVRLEREREGERLARRFHTLYESMAPGFGYETRTETREFDPESNNGKLMIAVCSVIAGMHTARLAEAEELNKPRMSLHAEIARLQQLLDEHAGTIRHYREKYEQEREDRQKAEARQYSVGAEHLREYAERVKERDEARQRSETYRTELFCLSVTNPCGHLGRFMEQGAGCVKCENKHLTARLAEAEVAMANRSLAEARYEELRELIACGSRSMAHEDLVSQLRVNNELIVTRDQKVADARAENDRLKEACLIFRTYGLPPNDVSGRAAWDRALLLLVGGTP